MADVFSNGEHPVSYPFTRSLVSLFDGDGYSEVERWRPGVEFVLYGAGDSEAVANAIGTMVLTEVSEHKPGRFPARIFYTRRWIDPDGHEFGNPRLHIATKQKFNRLCRGYQHRFRLDPRRIVNGIFEEAR